MEHRGWNGSPPSGSLHANKQSCQEGPVFDPALWQAKATQSHPHATPKPYSRHILGIDSGVQSHLKATPRLHQGSTKAPPRLHQGSTKAPPEPHQSHTNATLMRPPSHLQATSKPGQSWFAGPGLGGFPLYSWAKREEAQLGTATGVSPSPRQRSAGRGPGSTAIELRKFPRKTRRLLPLLPQGRRGLGRGGPNEFSCR